jgi:hypothetical protein
MAWAMVIVPACLVGGLIGFGGPALVGAMSEEAFSHWSHWVFAIAAVALAAVTAVRLRDYVGRRLVVTSDEVVLTRSNGKELTRHRLETVDARMGHVVQRGQNVSFPVPALLLEMGTDSLLLKGKSVPPDTDTPELDPHGGTPYWLSPTQWKKAVGVFC